MTDKRLVVTTAPNLSEARTLARTLVERKLAACVNLVPKIESIYRWEGKVESAEEYLLLIKTTVGMFESVRRAIQELHSYDVPECIALAIEDGSMAYLKWITESVEENSIG
jgi:periplasmic divalent cation tolerance protein